jgi:hypothetical protein
VVLWLLPILLFYLPLAAVVMKPSRSLPIEGGVYQWVKAGFSPFAGYMAGWTFSIYVLFAFATVGSVVANHHDPLGPAQFFDWHLNGELPFDRLKTRLSDSEERKSLIGTPNDMKVGPRAFTKPLKQFRQIKDRTARCHNHAWARNYRIYRRQSRQFMD